MRGEPAKIGARFLLRGLRVAIRARLSVFERGRVLARLVACGLACVAAALACFAVALACGWSGPPDSVRFGGWGAARERELARLPPLSFGERARPAERVEEDDVESYEVKERRRAALEKRCTEAADPSASAVRAAAEDARRQLRACLDELTDQDRRNTAIDLLDAFTALDAGSPPSSLQAYFKARQLYDQTLAAPPVQSFPYHPSPTPTPPSDAERESLRAAHVEEVSRALAPAAADRNLADNAAYLRAAILYRAAKYEEAADAFRRIVARAPRSEKREAALLMSGLASLKRSRAYVEGGTTATSEAPCADCRDEAWAAARASFERLLREHPRGRFHADARGWLAFLHLRVDDAGAGLAEYYRMLAEESGEAARGEALVSLRMARDEADEAALRRLEVLLADEPRAALVYAYHSLYNFAPAIHDWHLPPPERAEQELDEELSDDSGDPEWRERQRARRGRAWVRSAHGRELKRVADFAAAMLGRYPRAQVGGEFALRLAEVNFELDEPRPALSFAARALASGLAGEPRAEALWVKGAAEYRLGRLRDARRSLLTLIDESPRSRLAPGARRLVAVAAEDAGDLDAALEQYLALQYREDAAYLFDVLMTAEQLASFVERRPELPQRDELLYALGVRHLREGRYGEARSAYARVRTSPEGYSWGGDPAWPCHAEDGSRIPYDPHASLDGQRCDGPKQSYYDEGGGVRPRWVLNDLQTADALERFDRDFAAATGEEAKAEALYQKASYLFESDLLFYNPAAWRGSRFWLLADIDNSHAYRAPGEAQALFRYVERHDMAARALALYLEVARLFPRTRAARDALYTAAVCHQRLANYNDYWRARYSSGLHAGERMVTYADVRAAYPDYRFPSGTYGWEPSTRTVNGHGAWPAPPPPKPRPTRAQQLKRLALSYWLPASKLLAGPAARAWHWLTTGLVLAGCLLCARVAARARRQWHAALSRREAETKTAAETLRELWAAWREAVRESAGAGAAGGGRAGEPAGPRVPWLSHEPHQTRPEIYGHKFFHAAEAIFRATARALWHYVRPLTHDAHGRHTLAANAIAHALLVALLTTLVRLLYAS